MSKCGKLEVIDVTLSGIATGRTGGDASPPAYKSWFLKWPKSGEKFFKEWVFPSYANEDKVQSLQLPTTEPNLNKKVELKPYCELLLVLLLLLLLFNKVF